MNRQFFALLSAALFSAGASFADTIDFTGLPAGNLGGTVSVGGVTIEGHTSLRDESDDYFSGAGGAACASQGSGGNCRGTMNINFNGKVKKLSVNSAGYQAGDVGSILVYRGKNFLGSVGVASNGKVNLGAFGKVSRIKITYDGVEDGIAYGKFNFTRVAARHDKGGGAKPAEPEVVLASAGVSGGAGGKDRDAGKGGAGSKGGGKGDGKGGGGRGDGGSGHPDK